MLPILRYRRVWVIASCIVVAAALTVNLLPPDDVPTGGVNDKVLHFTGYVLLALWFAGLYPRSRYVWIALGLIAMGIFIEWAQGAMHLGRWRDYHDVIANCGGIAGGLVLGCTWLGQWAVRLEALGTRP